MEERGEARKGPDNSLEKTIFDQGESDLEPLHVRFQESTLERIEQLSEEHGVSQAEVVRTAVRKGLDSQYFNTAITLETLENLYHQTSNQEDLESIASVQEILLENSDYTTR